MAAALPRIGSAAVLSGVYQAAIRQRGGERERASTRGPPAEYPLPKVFSKLGIGSRRQLRHYLALAQPGRRAA
jgi:hypothetical protein